MSNEYDGVPGDIAIRRRDLLGTGSTLLNLACSGNPNGGFLKGGYYFLVGDSASGKTFLSMTCFAEASVNEHFAEYRFIYDDVEGGMLLDVDSLFGEAVADRLEPPALDGDEPVHSETVEDFYFNLDDAVKTGKPFIYILDSMDSLGSESSDKKFDQQKKATRKRKGASDGEEEEKITGSYGDGKAKKNSEFIRKALKGLRKTGSILIIISQTRDNIGSMYGGKTRSGGRSLRFYATAEIWSSIAEQIKRTVEGKKRTIGTRVRLETRKNRITGKLATIEVDIFPNHGIDDVGSCVDYLIEEGRWPTTGSSVKNINAKGLNLSGTRDKIIRQIERQSLEDDLRQLCAETWKNIDDACAVKRKSRYTTASDAGED